MSSRSGTGVASERDLRRWLQLALASIWLLDAVLQLQPMMFSRAFSSQMLAPAAHGNPAWVALPIAWAAALVGRSPELANGIFAGLQFAIALGIAWRPTLRPALALSIVWAMVVWWFGEGFGGLLAGSASPITGAPGAVLLYALLAILLWPRPSSTDPATRSAAASRLGSTATARASWVLLWGGLSWLAVSGASSAAGPVRQSIAQLGVGEPGWLSQLDRGFASLLGRHGAEVSLGLAAALAVVAVGIFLPRGWSRVTLLLGGIVALAIWVAGENFGGVFTGSATDPNSGILLLLLMVALWPRGVPGGATETASGGTRAGLEVRRGSPCQGSPVP